MVEKIKNIVRTYGKRMGNASFLDVNSKDGVHLTGSPSTEDNSHCIDCCDINEDGDCYVIFTDCSERFYMEDFCEEELMQIYSILARSL